MYLSQTKLCILKIDTHDYWRRDRISNLTLYSSFFIIVGTQVQLCRLTRGYNSGKVRSADKFYLQREPLVLGVQFEYGTAINNKHYITIKVAQILELNLWPNLVTENQILFSIEDNWSELLSHSLNDAILENCQHIFSLINEGLNDGIYVIDIVVELFNLSKVLLAHELDQCLQVNPVTHALP